MDLRLRDKAVLVTGASTGIGAAVARCYAAESANVVLTYHTRADDAAGVVASIEATGGAAMAVPYDLGDDGSIQAAVGAAVERWGRLDVLVANAVSWPRPPGGTPPFDQLPADEWRATVRAVLEGTILTVQAAAPHLVAAGEGRVVLVSSTMARDGQVGAVAYGAAKAGLEGLSASVARELGPDGVLVNVVMPGLTITERTSVRRPQQVLDAALQATPTARLTTVDDVARVVTFLGSPANGNVTGEVVRVSGGR